MLHRSYIGLMNLFARLPCGGIGADETANTGTQRIIAMPGGLLLACLIKLSMAREDKHDHCDSSSAPLWPSEDGTLAGCGCGRQHSEGGAYNRYRR
jgi:hypothetical protein